MSEPGSFAHAENALTMKLPTHNHVKLTVVSAVLTLCVSALAGGPHKNHHILHVSIQKKMHNEGVLADASGKADLRYDAEGDKAADQDLHLHIKGLDASGAYQLSAQADGDTNLTQVLSFTTDHEGKADIHLKEKGPKHPHNHDGHVDGQLPAELLAVTGIHGLIIFDAADTNGTPILTADLTAPDKFEYLAKRDLSTDTVHAKLEIKANGHKAKLHLEANGLEAGSQYSLAVNGNVVTTVTSKEDGHLDIHAQLENAEDVFALSTVAILDASSNTVVSTSFP